MFLSGSAAGDRNHGDGKRSLENWSKIAILQSFLLGSMSTNTVFSVCYHWQPRLPRQPTASSYSVEGRRGRSVRAAHRIVKPLSLCMTVSTRPSCMSNSRDRDFSVILTVRRSRTEHARHVYRRVHRHRPNSPTTKQTKARWCMTISLSIPLFSPSLNPPSEGPFSCMSLFGIWLKMISNHIFL